MKRPPYHVAILSGCATLLVLSAGCGGGSDPPAPKPKAAVAALAVPVSPLAAYLAERKAIAEGREKATVAVARTEATAEQQDRVARALERGNALLAGGRYAEAAAELKPAAAIESLPPEKRGELLLALATALGQAGDAAAAAECQAKFNACMKQAIEGKRETEARERFAGLVLTDGLTRLEGGDPDKFFSDAPAGE